MVLSDEKRALLGNKEAATLTHHHGRDHQDVQGARNYGPVCAEPGFHPVSHQGEDGKGGPTMKLEEAIAKAKILNDSLKELADEYEGQGSFMAAGMAVTFKLVLDTILSALRPVSKEQVEKMRKGEWEDMREAYNDVPKRRCSRCKRVFIGLDTPFCEACGAPMS